MQKILWKMKIIMLLKKYNNIFNGLYRLTYAYYKENNENRPNNKNMD